MATTSKFKLNFVNMPKCEAVEKPEPEMEPEPEPEQEGAAAAAKTAEAVEAVEEKSQDRYESLSIIIKHFIEFFRFFLGTQRTGKGLLGRHGGHHHNGNHRNRMGEAD